MFIIIYLKYKINFYNNLLIYFKFQKEYLKMLRNIKKELNKKEDQDGEEEILGKEDVDKTAEDVFGSNETRKNAFGGMGLKRNNFSDDEDDDDWGFQKKVEPPKP